MLYTKPYTAASGYNPCSGRDVMLLSQKVCHGAMQLQHCSFLHSFPVLQVIQRGFNNLKAHVTTFTSTSLTPDELHFELELTSAWSVMIEVFVALHSKLGTSTGQHLQLVKMLTSYVDVTRSLLE